MEPSAPHLQLLFLVAILIPAILFLLTQQRTLEAIRPENRRMRPGQVWLQLIPLFGSVYQFLVIRRIADSIFNELNMPTGDSVFADDGEAMTSRPTYSLGLTYAILLSTALFPIFIFSGLLSLAGLAVWICYWVQLNRYRQKIKRRMFLQ